MEDVIREAQKFLGRGKGRAKSLCAPVLSPFWDTYTGTLHNHATRHASSNPGFLVRRGDNTLILPTGDITQRSLKMLLWRLQSRRLLVCIEIRVDELDETVDVFGRHLQGCCQ